LLPELSETLSEQQDQLDQLTFAEHRRHLNECVAKLPVDQCQAIALRFGADLDYAQIAQITDCPEATIRSRIFLGIARLRKLVRKWGES
jgi:RNA polymerase sigma-70 factor (ECF subfamily)